MNVPRMLTRIPDGHPIYNHTPRDILRRTSRPNAPGNAGRIGRQAPEPSTPLAASTLPELEPTGGELCWSGWCPGCGRALISATTHPSTGPYAFRCGLCDPVAA